MGPIGTSGTGRYDRNMNSAVFVNRVKADRKKRNDDIPFAQRTNPIRRFSSKKVVYFSVSSIFFSILVTFFVSNFIFQTKIPGSFSVNGDLLLKNGSLLGHFPYPEASSESLVKLYPGFSVHKDTLKALKKMESAALLDGVELVFLSGYRSIDLQREIFYENKSIRNQIAIERAKVSAPPGYSEHSTGYAVDIGDRNMRHTDFEVEFESTPAFLWLKKNAAKYHFVLSFPRGNPQKVSYEPWHWRYEGTVEALKLFEPSNKTLMKQN